MYAGARSEPLLRAAAAWNKLADDLYGTAASVGSITSALTDEGWRGPASDSMAAAVAPYLRWLTGTAGAAEQIAGQARAAACAFENAFAATVPPPVIAANRARLASLIAANATGQDTPAIAALEADYSEMWARDACAMYRYANASAAAATLTPLALPTLGDNLPGFQEWSADAGMPDMLAQTMAQTMAGVPAALRSLGRPVQPVSAASTIANMLRFKPLPSPVSAFVGAISAPLAMTPAAMATKVSGSSRLVVSAAWSRAALVGRMSVPRSWGVAALGATGVPSTAKSTA
ncbi:hypothetical protein A4G28_08960 [Mycobacterium ostraviense]|uniref:PPE domain-containing protein n=2 Tax=Mycobacterium ostraviense TaxID=2738409 RepID=A0A163XYX9_9MYCO|nr:hypothetical protein A4G28_08960 [Mycobacterium ostraviense]